jgi:hypothetical protein
MPGSLVSTRSSFCAARASVPSATLDLARVDRAADADAAAVVERHPGSAGRRVEQRVQQRPVGDRVGAVLHRLGLAVRRRHGAGVEVVAADHDRADSSPEATISLNLSPARWRSLYPSQQMRAGRPSKCTFSAALVDPAVQGCVLGEELEDRPVGLGDVFGVAGEGGPAERSRALSEERADVGRHESGELERPVVAAQLRLGADRVAVVEHLGAGVLEGRPSPRRARPSTRASALLGEASGSRVASAFQSATATPPAGRRAGRARWSGRSRCRSGRPLAAVPGTPRRVADDADRQRTVRRPWRRPPGDGCIEVGLDVEVAVLDAAGETGLVDVDRSRRRRSSSRRAAARRPSRRAPPVR